MKIDKNSLIDVFTEIIARTVSPVKPVLVYDDETGEFSIQSKLTPMNCHEHIISGQLDTSDGMDAFLGDLDLISVAVFVANMDNDYIKEYIIGDIEEK